jgi:hypothetical protein
MFLIWFPYLSSPAPFAFLKKLRKDSINKLLPQYIQLRILYCWPYCSDNLELTWFRKEDKIIHTFSASASKLCMFFMLLSGFHASKLWFSRYGVEPGNWDFLKLWWHMRIVERFQKHWCPGPFSDRVNQGCFKVRPILSFLCSPFHIWVFLIFHQAIFTEQNVLKHYI